MAGDIAAEMAKMLQSIDMGDNPRSIVQRLPDKHARLKGQNRARYENQFPKWLCLLK